MTPGEVAAILETSGQAFASLLRGLTSEASWRPAPEEWCVNECARLSVEDLLHEWIHPDANHLRQAYANVQAYVWPRMGNARRFSYG